MPFAVAMTLADKQLLNYMESARPSPWTKPAILCILVGKKLVVISQFKVCWALAGSDSSSKTKGKNKWVRYVSTVFQASLLSP